MNFGTHFTRGTLGLMGRNAVQNRNDADRN
jgi:hypothetical protein